MEAGPDLLEYSDDIIRDRATHFVLF